MNTLILTSDLQAVIGELKVKTAIKDASGTVLGIYTPWPEAEAELYERISKLFDLEEAERALAEGGPSLSTKEVLEKLQALEPSK